MNCKNCRTALTSENNFCNSCGAKVIHNQLTLKNVFEDFSEQFLNYDNKFLLTFIALYKKPEDVLNGYVTGTRKKYVNVLNYIALAVTVSGLQLYILFKFFPDAMKLPDYMIKNSAIGQGVIDSVYEYYSFLFIALIPLYALISKLVFKNIKKYNYVEHIVIIAYTQAHLSITFFIPVVILSMIGFNLYEYNYINLAIMILYTAYCFKKLYQLSLKRIIIKTFVFIGIGLLFYIFMLIIFMILMLTYLYLTGGMEEFMESQKTTAYLVSSAINWTS
tara:strand:+ start:185 stop:1012 length:828 start_codon:yes stop_codon:yes gene_type:complete